jgi:hypothetical protein
VTWRPFRRRRAAPVRRLTDELIPVYLRGMVVEGKDGQHHNEKCCSIPPSNAWSREEKGLDDPEFLSAPWLVPAIPRKGETLELPSRDGDGCGTQGMTVEEVVYKVGGGIEIWLGGWTHWEAADVRAHFTLAAKWWTRWWGEYLDNAR